MDKNIVYEYNEKADPNYIGTRFMTNWTKDVQEDPNGPYKIIAQGVSYEKAVELVENAPRSSKEAFLNDMPDEFRSPEMDDFIRNL